ncbi:alpha/beta hydrolase [Mucilaginibacter sp.]|uniref:alpha/beta fold hydrolase n=1 Tax=Mucilaginibacter sp. TaxID=1882438 RepID=UPI0026175AFA|nr:alpha/beta hydrolase [Mucilaginibacter sp.]MDB4926520.1 alpha/beta hydrolase [Mucilaginibacter sp.]
MFLTIKGKTIAVDVTGEGEAIILVHGLGGTSNFWAPATIEFGKQYKLIAPDLPSAGRSDNAEGISIPELAEYMFAVLDELGIDKAKVIGHSMGTIVCQHMAASQPGRVTDLVLLGPLAEAPEPARPALKDRAALVREKGMTPVADAISVGGLSEETKTTRGVVVGYVRESLMRQNAEGYAQSCIALSESVKADPEKITCKTLLITGDEDKTAPPANVEKLHAAISGSQYELLSGCGHWTISEKPNEVLALIKKFYTA